MKWGNSIFLNLDWRSTWLCAIISAKQGPSNTCTFSLLGVLLKCRFWFCRFELGPDTMFSIKFWSDTNAVGPGSPLWVAKVLPVLLLMKIGYGRMPEALPMCLKNGNFGHFLHLSSGNLLLVKWTTGSNKLFLRLSLNEKLGETEG